MCMFVEKQWCLTVSCPRLRCVLCSRAGACFFSFRGFRLVTLPRCGGRFFAGFASGFRWCLAVLSRSPGGCCFGRVWARLRCVLCPRAGACFFSFRGFRLVTSARCGGGFFAGFASGFRWCGGCCFGRVWARLRCVLCPRAPSPLGVSDLSLRHAAGEGFLLGLRPDLGGVWMF